MNTFDPLKYLPKNYYPTVARLDALFSFYDEFKRPPTEAEVLSILGKGVEFGQYTDPLPDGFVGKDWNNPNWTKRLKPVVYDEPVDAPFSDYLLAFGGETLLTPQSSYIILPGGS